MKHDIVFFVIIGDSDRFDTTKGSIFAAPNNGSLLLLNTNNVSSYHQEMALARNRTACDFQCDDAFYGLRARDSLKERFFVLDQMLERTVSVSFYGYVEDCHGGTTVVSFPGAYTAEWAMLVERSQKLQESTRKAQQEEEEERDMIDVMFRPKETTRKAHDGAETVDPNMFSAGSTSCVFLPPGSRLFGLHSPNTVDEEAKEYGHCWCVALYGAKAEFGCRWFACWKEQLDKARQANHQLIVVFKAGQSGEGAESDWPPKLACNETNRGLPGLGVSQRGEVAFMRKLGLSLQHVDINEFRRRLLGELEAELETLRRTGNAEAEEVAMQVQELKLQLELNALTDQEVRDT